jgi:hypothetical protein
LNGTWVNVQTLGEYVYEIPSQLQLEQNNNKGIKGIIILFHGCHHWVYDWWKKSPNCVDCIGLPIETKVVFESLKRGFITVAISSKNREKKCWSHSDVHATANLINLIYKEFVPNKNKLLPVHLLGSVLLSFFLFHLFITISLNKYNFKKALWEELFLIILM